MKKIDDIAFELGVSNNLVKYSDYIGKISKSNFIRRGKLILVTAINPTPYGEGKTTVSIGLVDGLKKVGKKSIGVLREPSMGPVFGIKGGATGGGCSKVVPEEEINLHFTGDFHAITSCNNLLCAAIDNHIFHGNELGIVKKTLKRCIDVNDRFLRDKDFVITAASEVMSVFCLASDIEDLRRRLGNIIIGYNKLDEVVLAKELGIVGSLVSLLKDSFNPNLVQTLEGNPVLIHGGPFANIAHGCNSVVATKMALGLSDYVVTEAGFGADLGGFKFFDIKSRKMNIYPDAVVLVATIKALKYNGNNNLEVGIFNLEKHILNMKLINSNLVVCLNKFNSDLDSEINIVKDLCDKLGVSFSVSTSFIDGGNGAVDLANEVIRLCDLNNDVKLLYDVNMNIKDKISVVSRNVFGAVNINYSSDSLDKIELIRHNNLDNMPICVSKTPYSFSDNAKLLGAPSNFDMLVTDIAINNGGEFITVYMGDVMTMPGLSKEPNYLKIDLVDDKIVGIE